MQKIMEELLTNVRTSSLHSENSNGKIKIKRKNMKSTAKDAIPKLRRVVEFSFMSWYLQGKL